MQGKFLLVTFLFTISAVLSKAQEKPQHYQDFVMKGSQSHRIKSDTIITVGKPAKNTEEAATANTVAPANATVAAANNTSEVFSGTNNQQYKHVPLAGEKSYFGEMNEYVNDFVRKYLELHNQTLNVVQSNDATPFSVIDNVLAKNNIPSQLKYLAVIESALNHNAVSHAGAVGPWQLMQSTARMMGLCVNRHQDDRKDWYKSTDAAARYLSLLYSQLNDWLLVIAAYNSGPTPVQRAIDKTGSHSFWDIKPYLPRETQGHVLAFIATASIFENLSKFIGLGSIPVDFQFNKEEPIKTTGKPVVKKAAFTDDELKNMSIIRISEPLYMDLLSTELGIDKKLLARWNPDYDLFVYNTYPTPYYSLRIPKDKVDVFLSKKDFLTKKSKQIFGQNL